MAKSFTYKQKFFGVLLGIVLLLLASYKKTYKHLFAASEQVGLLDHKLLNVENSYNEVYVLKNEISSLDNIIGGQSNTPEDVQQQILNFVSNSNYDVDISLIEDTHLFSDKEFLVYTNSIEIEGTYFDLTKLLYDIERKFDVSKIISAELFSVKDYRNNSKRLYLKLIFQNYENNK